MTDGDGDDGKSLVETGKQGLRLRLVCPHLFSPQIKTENGGTCHTFALTTPLFAACHLCHHLPMEERLVHGEESHTHHHLCLCPPTRLRLSILTPLLPFFPHL